MFAGFSLVGFSGSRALSGARFRACRALAAAASAAGAEVVTGCAAGADRAARQGAGVAHVFRVSSGRWGAGPGAFAGRSAHFVRWVAAGGGCLVSFPAGPCPVGLVPSASSSRCWAGFGSGSWASLAFAVGLGVPVFVFLPVGVFPPAAWGVWVRLVAGPLSGSWVLVPKTAVPEVAA